jgi:hypothetical protein
MDNDKKPLPLSFYILIVILLITAGVFIVLILNPVPLLGIRPSINQIVTHLTKTPSSAVPSPSPTPVTNAKIIPIIQGEAAYNISQGKTNGPKITRAVINPQDPQEGAKQTVTVSTNHTKPITWVKVSVYSDNKIASHDLTLSSGTTLSGNWSGSWTTDDTHLHKWGILIESGDGVAQSKAGIAIR